VTDVEDADRDILKLADEQFRVLDMLDGEPRVAVSGPAGSARPELAPHHAFLLFECRPGDRRHRRRPSLGEPGLPRSHRGTL
jgi:hypothetical protein